MSGFNEARGTLTILSEEEYEDIIMAVQSQPIIGYSNKEDIKEDLSELLAITELGFDVVEIGGSYYKLTNHAESRDPDIQRVSLQRNAEGGIEFNMLYYDCCSWEEAIVRQLNEFEEK